MSTTTTNSSCDSIAFFGGAWVAPYNATYTFCEQAARDCGGNNATSMRVVDASAGDDGQGLELYYFYAEQATTGSASTCLSQRYSNLTTVWAAGTEAQQRARAAAPGANGARRRGGSTRSTLVTMLAMLAVAVVTIECAIGGAYAAPKCQRFEPSGQPQSSFLGTQKLSPSIDCVNSATCYLAAADGEGKTPVSSSYTLTLSRAEDASTDATLADGFLQRSFNATLAQQYSDAMTERSLPLLTFALAQRGRGFLAASHDGDLYNGTLQDCNDGNTYPAELHLPIGDFYYNVVQF